MEPLRELSNQLGHPSADKLWQAAQRNNLPVTRKAVIAFVQASAPRQVFKKRANYEGKIPAVEINDRWAADLIDYTAKPSPSKNGGDPFQYILIVQDIFSRKIFVHALRSKTAEVCEQAFASIVRRAGIPDRLDTDNGLEFRGPFDQYLVEEKIYHQVADSRNKNARATLDAAIKQLRQQLARIQAVEGHRDWASVLQRAADAYNDTVHTHLIGRAPDDVKGDDTLQFDLRSQAARDIAHNDALISARARRLEHFGNFRVEQPQNKFERSFHPRFFRRRARHQACAFKQGGGRGGERISHPPRSRRSCAQWTHQHRRHARGLGANRPTSLANSGTLQTTHLRFCGRPWQVRI